MFTGIIESMGQIESITKNEKNKTFWVRSEISSSLKIDQSVCHDGVCLTVEEIKDGSFRVTAIAETLKKTNLGGWKSGYQVNLERSLLLGSRLDGHIVQGHADATATCIQRKEIGGSWEFGFEFPKKFNHLVIEKGSVCVNGISLTAFDVKNKSFKIAVIPYTFEHTNIKNVKRGSIVNIEFDMIGKYISRMKEVSR